jgi:nitrogen fixation/metabolism regulation signal transduction histidine kinase
MSDESILESLPIGIVAFDSNLKIVRANVQAARLIELGDYINKSLAKGTDNKIWQGWTQHLTSAISTRLNSVKSGSGKFMQKFAKRLEE